MPEYQRIQKNFTHPYLKGASVAEDIYIGDDYLETLTSSLKNEAIE
jgi:hypothetical protein